MSGFEMAKCFAPRQILACIAAANEAYAQFPGFPNTWPFQALATIVTVMASGLNFDARGRER